MLSTLLVYPPQTLEASKVNPLAPVADPVWFGVRPSVVLSFANAPVIVAQAGSNHQEDCPIPVIFGAHPEFLPPIV